MVMTHLEVPGIYILDRSFAGTQKIQNTPPFRTGRQALDIGCGNGKFLQQAAERWGGKRRVSSSTTGAVSVCRDSGLNVSHGDLHSAAFPR